MLRFWGRCEGNVNVIEFGDIETEAPRLFGNFSKDYSQVVIWNE